MDNLLTDDDVLRIAERAKLAFDGDALAAMKRHLQKQIRIFGLFDTVNTDGVEQMSFATDIHNATRADVPAPSLSASEITSGASETKDGYFAVPRSVR